tara:strand:- start:385 stop:810 length:426 start_codon:yes stop_codon:yes gene_type:complete
MLIYCHLPKDRLYFGVKKNYDHPVAKKRLKRIKDSIKKIGFLNPFSCGNEKDDGTYQVNRGNSCLQAAMELNIKSIPCVVYCKENQKYIPEGEQVKVSELQKFHKSKIRKVSGEYSIGFGVYPLLVDKYETFHSSFFLNNV